MFVMEETEENLSNVFERNPSFIVRSIGDSDDDSDETKDLAQYDEAQDNDTFAELPNIKTNAILINRKRKPPNLKLALRSGHDLLRQNAQEETPSPVSSTGDDLSLKDSSVPTSSVRVAFTQTTDAGRSSPIVKRSSMLEKILEIPDVKAALVMDEGYEMLRRRSYDKTSTTKAVIDRQLTPGGGINVERFSFDPNSPKEFDSESISESDTSSIISAQEILAEGDKPSAVSRRHHIEILKDAKSVVNPFDRIADSTVPAIVFGSPIKKQELSATSPSLKKKIKKKLSSQEDDDDQGKPPTPRSRALLMRLKFSTLSRSSSNSSFEGWDSLARALARVGATIPAVNLDAMDENDLFPKLNSILKRRFRSERLSIGCSPQEPGTKPTIRKKTVSFSRLPSEWIVKNAADCIYRMHEGHQFVKMRSNSRVYNRLYWFDQAENCLRWEPSKKDAGKARIEITSIREVRPGKTTELFISSDISTHFPDECSFSIIHREGKTLDLIANSADDANVWITGLRCLISGQDIEELKMRSDARDSWLSSVFDGADINGDGYLDEEECLKLLTSLSDCVRELRVKQRLQEYLQMKENNRAHVSRAEFIKLFKDVATRPEIYFMLARYAASDDRMTIDDLMTFLESEQGASNVTKDDCLEIINTFEPSDRLKAIPALGIDGFTKYLNSSRCAIFNPKQLEICQDMTRPLSDYFIASSHNTYLMEDQVGGPSNVNAYVRALLRCCRCVELDCWDGPDDEPVVTHGHSKTNNISFRQVIQVINDSAFRNSSYPVILSFENHCSENQQLLMAKYLNEILGSKIYKKSLSDVEKELPSPESLKNHFLIRARKLPDDTTEDVGYVSGEDEGKEVGYQLVTSPPSPDGSSSSVSDQAEQRQALVRPLSDLVSICACVTQIEDLTIHHRSFSCQHTSSIGEKEAFKLLENFPDEFATHNKKFLTRVYPSPLRFDSSNFNPQEFWNCGVQIASLNYQTPGLMMDINDGKFIMNGGCGYVLKPEVMRDPLAYYSLTVTDSLPGVAPKNLHIRVISGQNFPKPRGGGAKGHVIDPYVLIELFGIPCDCADYRTRTASNNSGGSPIFDEPFEFRLALPDLALVRFVVLDDDYIGDEFIGQCTIPYQCLLPGYRHLHLRSIFDEPLDNATLFVHIAIVDADFIPNTPGNSIPISLVNSTKTSGTKRINSQKKTKKFRSRKESELVQLLEVNRPELDDVFSKTNEHIHLAASLRDSYRLSFNLLRETCAISPLSSIKQCVRSLAQRSRTDAPPCDPTMVRNKRKSSYIAEAEQTVDAGKGELQKRVSSSDSASGRLRRQHSDTSHSSSSDSGTAGQVRLVKSDRKISLQLKGNFTNNEVWRKLSSCLDTLVDDCLVLLDKAKSCCDQLISAYDRVIELKSSERFDFASNVTDPEFGNQTATLNGTQTRKANKMKKKHSTLSRDSDRKKKKSSDENFRWNCSIIRGHRNMLLSAQENAERLLTDLWDAALQYRLADNADFTSSDHVNGFEKSIDSAVNTNSNNNSAPSSDAKLSEKSGTKSLKSNQFVRSVSLFTKPRSKSTTKLPQTSVSGAALPIKLA